MDEIKIICLTPIKNEEWILERFLKCTSLWADMIILADQNSTDRSTQIAKKFKKVVLIKNDSDSFNEPERQKLLINEARKIPGKKILFALDADEIFTENLINCKEWKQVIKLQEGTHISFEWINVHEYFKTYWTKGFHSFGFVDDGSNHFGHEIDSSRLPNEDIKHTFKVQSIKLMHFQYTDLARVRYKQVWYQCLEKTMKSLNKAGEKRSNFYLFKRYCKIHFNPKLQNMHSTWIEKYQELGIDLTQSTPCQIPHVLYIKELFNLYSVQHFDKLDIWDVDWNLIFNSNQYSDPRSWVTKKIHKWLRNRDELKFSFLEKVCISILEKVNLF